MFCFASTLQTFMHGRETSWNLVCSRFSGFLYKCRRVALEDLEIPLADLPKAALWIRHLHRQLISFWSAALKLNRFFQVVSVERADHDNGVNLWGGKQGKRNFINARIDTRACARFVNWKGSISTQSLVASVKILWTPKKDCGEIWVAWWCSQWVGAEDVPFTFIFCFVQAHRHTESASSKRQQNKCMRCKMQKKTNNWKRETEKLNQNVTCCCFVWRFHTNTSIECSSSIFSFRSVVC